MLQAAQPRFQAEKKAIPNPLIEAIKDGSAPRPARMAAAKGMLPLANEEMLEALVVLVKDEAGDIREAAVQTMDGLDPGLFAAMATDEKAPPEILGFLVLWQRAAREMVEAAIFNPSTPDEALVHLAGKSADPRIIETVSLKQLSLIRCPGIIDAILSNPARTPDAERRATEVRQEFFEKQFGAKLVAGEVRARETGAAQKAGTITISGLEDMVALGLVEEGIDDSIIAEYEAEVGLLDDSPPGPDDRIDIDRVVNEVEWEQPMEIQERLPVFQRIAMMSIKDRVMLAIKGTREARTILVRDPNRIVAGAVLRNPRLTDQEIEMIASIKTVPEDVLRLIGMNRAWTRSYAVIHNLVKNPRTPIAISLGMLNRIQTRDMRALSTNKNIPDVIRTTASRIYIKRSQG